MNVARGLSYDQGPPLAAPLRLFELAALFLIATAVAALALGDAWQASRWSPAALALTHLLTLGYLGAIMAGALLQMLPVVVGTPVPGVAGIAASVLVGLGVGVPLLALGLLLGEPALLLAAALLLALAWLPFLGGTLIALVRARSVPQVVWPMRKAWLALLVTLLLGWSLAGGLAGAVPLPDPILATRLHAAWGLAGWVLLLVMGVAYQVVPMLQITPAYPDAISRRLTWALLAGLLLYSGAGLSGLDGDDGVAWLAVALLAGGTIVFAFATLDIQRRRRRRLPDVTLDFWRLGMASLILAAMVAVLLPRVPEARREAAELGLGIVFLLGFAASVVNGMLYKIVPFLAWFHLQAQTGAKATQIPSMKQMIPDPDARRHFRLHLAACLLLAPVPFLPPATAIPGLLLLAASGQGLWLNLLRARRLFLAYGGRLAQP